ncbi:hypothetical protein LB465_03090 [Salegentibacter sp. LM13S]|uniref:hypothetical protein n=1 Tax=Salegentibacter lacus TaxID=2873599 RepID=UPI001CCAF93F|nr:hypothetical protein [Salegentibacter lacus]MBZ9629752.1 hypothetical protein [Salegentibacter lacus]
MREHYSLKKIIALFLFITSISFAQEQTPKNPVSIIGEFGINKHGTGDMSGYLYGLRVHKPISKKFEIIASFEANLNDGEDSPFIWEDPNGNIYDSTLHDVLAGFQLNAGIGFNFINSKRSKFGVNPSIFGRYQTNSVFSESSIDYPIITGMPFPIRYLIRHEPGRTYAVGGSIRLYYHYKINDRFLLGINPGLQTDSQGDTMLFTSLSFGIFL